MLYESHTEMLHNKFLDEYEEGMNAKMIEYTKNIVIHELRPAYKESVTRRYLPLRSGEN